MPSYLNTNMASLIAQNNMGNSQSNLTTAIQRLSSGLRINSAADDAAGYAIAQNMTTQVNGYTQASLNATNGVSLAQTAQGDMSTILANLQTIRGLAVEAANATNTSTDRANLNAQVQQLLSENQRISTASNFNGVNLLDGSFTAETFQVGANNNSSSQIQISSIANLQNSALGNVTTSATVSGAVASGTGLTAGEITLNGVQVGASVAGSQAGQNTDSAYAIAQAINAVQAQSGVFATAGAATVSGTVTGTSAIAANTFTINGVGISAVAAGGTASGEAANIAAAINAASAQTGVTATAQVSGAGLTLTAADGRDIVLGGTLTGTGLTAGTSTGTISLTNSTTINGGAITVSGGGVSTIFSSGITATTTAATTQLNSMSSLNVLSQTSAQNALATIDAAIQTVTSSAAAMGAYQNRFSATINSIQTDQQNLQSSLAAIQDTNYAAETAVLSQNNILSQAGTAMLAQANQLPNQILTLLR